MGIARLMAAQLSRLLGATSVSSTEDVLGRPDFRVAVDVRRFETDPGHAVTLEALWTVRGDVAAGGGLALSLVILFAYLLVLGTALKGRRLPVPTRDWWELLHMTPEQLRQQLQMGTRITTEPPAEKLSGQEVAA